LNGQDFRRATKLRAADGNELFFFEILFETYRKSKSKEMQ